MGSSAHCTNSPDVRQQTLQTIMMQKLDLLWRTMWAIQYALMGVVGVIEGLEETLSVWHRQP